MESRFAALAQLLHDALDAGLGSALALSVGAQHREQLRLWRGALQRVPARGALVEEDSWFDLASLTKPMATATAAMVLVDRGRLDLAAPIRRWLPDAASEGTVAQLLGHAAGCAAHVRFYEQLRAGQLDGAATPRRALLQLARRHPTSDAAGVRNVYSDLGYLMLGELLERSTERRLDELVLELVTEPLGIAARYLDLEDPQRVTPVSVVATEVESDGPLIGAVHDENARAGGGVFGHAGLFGRIGDVATFAQAVLAMAAGTSPLVGAATARTFFESAPGRGSWRLGWDTPSPTLGVSHAGDLWPRQGAVGHLGFTGTSLWLDLPRGRWVALLSNRVHPTRDGSAEAIRALRRAVMDEAWRALEQP